MEIQSKHKDSSVNTMEINDPDFIRTNSILSAFQIIKANDRKGLISENKCIRRIARLKGLSVMTEREAQQYFALCDAFDLLAEKHIPVYYYNRIGKKKSGFEYTDLEKKRMERNISFPEMFENPGAYIEDLRDIFCEKYSSEYIKEIGRIPQVVRKGNYYLHEDFHSKYINVQDGKRMVCFQPESYEHTLHIYGRCGVFGYAVEDADSLPSLMQKELISRGHKIRIINHGLWGGLDEYLINNFLNDSIGMREGDIVLFYMKHIDMTLLGKLVGHGVYYKDITDEWHNRKNADTTFFNQPGHMNAYGYSIVSKIICDDLEASGFSGKIPASTVKIIQANNLNSYLKSQKNTHFEQEIAQYIESIIKQYPVHGLSNCGAIVMNCNPFTKGHRHLIETASESVERLYIFVVEEDKSFFKYNDRFEMVQKGTADLDNIVVVPSGKFIISAYTFPEYFMKDYVKEKNFDASLDLETFCKFIAPPLRITKRFAGEEPFDPVTKNYNDFMKKLLPSFGIEFHEIPRFAIDNERVINATAVRRLLKEKNLKELREYVPESTYTVLAAKYLDGE